MGSIRRMRGGLVRNPSPSPQKERGDRMREGDAGKLKAREALVANERERLAELYKEIPEKQKKIVEGLVIQAARLRILLDEMWVDITEKGDYEMFSQSEKQDPYERERPVAKLYNSRNDSYYRIIKQLSDFLPTEGGKNDVSVVDGRSDLI